MDQSVGQKRNVIQIFTRKTVCVKRTWGRLEPCMTPNFVTLLASNWKVKKKYLWLKIFKNDCSNLCYYHCSKRCPYLCCYSFSESCKFPYLILVGVFETLGTKHISINFFSKHGILYLKYIFNYTQFLLVILTKLFKNIIK